MQTACVSLVVRALTAADIQAALALLSMTFGEVPHPDDRACDLDVVDPSRFYGAEVCGELVGTAGSFALTLTVPGGPAPVAGVTWVGVSPVHRRQGVLHALMRRQLDDLHARGEAVAALWASEGGIYPRFGYAPAAWDLRVTLPHGAPFLTPVPRHAPGQVGLRLAAPDQRVLAPLYDAVLDRRPGWFARDDAWWRYRLHDPEHARPGATPLQAAVADVDASGGGGGYVLYRQRSAWTDGIPTGSVEVVELVAGDAAVRARLWRHVLDLDLTAEVTARCVPTDDPLLQLLAEPRRARARTSENLWVRLVDVPAALALRRYACDVDVVVQVADPVCPWNEGTFRLTGGRDGATCTRIDSPAELALSSNDLAAAYLGGTPLSARAATVRELVPGALSRTSTAFGPLDGSPCCPMVF